MGETTAEEVLSGQQLARRRFVGRLVLGGAFVVIAAGVGTKLWYDEKVADYSESKEYLRKILISIRKKRFIPYEIDDKFTLDSNRHLYVPQRISGINIKLQETGDMKDKLIAREPIDYRQTLEAKLHYHPGWFGTTLLHEGDKLLVTEAELSVQMVSQATTRARALKASTIVPSIDFVTELRPNVLKGRPEYWDSKTTVSGTIAYYK